MLRESQPAFASSSAATAHTELNQSRMLIRTDSKYFGPKNDIKAQSRPTLFNGQEFKRKSEDKEVYGKLAERRTGSLSKS